MFVSNYFVLLGGVAHLYYCMYHMLVRSEFPTPCRCFCFVSSCVVRIRVSQRFIKHAHRIQLGMVLLDSECYYQSACVHNQMFGFQVPNWQPPQEININVGVLK